MGGVPTGDEGCRGAVACNTWRVRMCDNGSGSVGTCTLAMGNPAIGWSGVAEVVADAVPGSKLPCTPACGGVLREATLAGVVRSSVVALRCAREPCQPIPAPSAVVTATKVIFPSTVPVAAAVAAMAGGAGGMGGGSGSGTMCAERLDQTFLTSMARGTGGRSSSKSERVSALAPPFRSRQRAGSLMASVLSRQRR